MTASDRREAIIDAAKEDARQAVDLLLDAIGRILLAHIEAHVEATPPPPAALERVSRAGRAWMLREDELVTLHYPEHGAAGVLTAGVNRSESAVRQRADTLGVKRAYNPRNHTNSAGVQDTQCTPPPPTPPRTPTRRVLERLVERDQADMLLDTDELTLSEQAALRKLRRNKLAAQEAPGLWRPTLAGLTEARKEAS